jgi:hypothetical protein
MQKPHAKSQVVTGCRVSRGGGLIKLTQMRRSQKVPSKAKMGPKKGVGSGCCQRRQCNCTMPEKVVGKARRDEGRNTSSKSSKERDV